MLENVESIFDNYKEMLKKLKKKVYQENMSKFRDEYGHYFEEMVECVDEALEEDKTDTINEIAVTLIDAVKQKYEKNGKMNGRTQADLNFFMIYYVFPAILLIENENVTLIADEIRDEWRKTFKNSNISYTDYESLLGSFREKIFGIF